MFVDSISVWMCKSVLCLYVWKHMYLLYLQLNSFHWRRELVLGACHESLAFIKTRHLRLPLNDINIVNCNSTTIQLSWFDMKIALHTIPQHLSTYPTETQCPPSGASNRHVLTTNRYIWYIWSASASRTTTTSLAMIRRKRSTTTILASMSFWLTYTYHN